MSTDAALLASCKELRSALQATLTVLATLPDPDVADRVVQELLARWIAPGINVRAEAAIHAAERRARDGALFEDFAIRVAIPLEWERALEPPPP